MGDNFDVLSEIRNVEYEKELLENFLKTEDMTYLFKLIQEVDIETREDLDEFMEEEDIELDSTQEKELEEFLADYLEDY